MNRTAALDGWRGVAILAVIIGHFLPIPFINAGRFGVELFFVLSGRLMGEILFVRNENLIQFYWRRISRIIPTLYIYLLICYFLTENLPLIHLNINSAISAATFTYNYLHTEGYGAAVVDHVWSLCIEEHTYIFLGALAFTAVRLNIKPWKVCFTLAIACMINGFYLTYVDGLDYYYVFWRTDTRATGILLGCGFYCCAIENPHWFKWVTGNSLILLFILALAASLYPVPDPYKYSVGTTSLAIVLVFINKLPPILIKIFENNLLRFFGITSFSLYIWQQLFYHLIPEHNPIEMLISAIIAGIASYFLIETPLRNSLNRFSPIKYARGILVAKR